MTHWPNSVVCACVHHVQQVRDGWSSETHGDTALSCSIWSLLSWHTLVDSVESLHTTDQTVTTSPQSPQNTPTFPWWVHVLLDKLHYVAPDLPWTRHDLEHTWTADTRHREDSKPLSTAVVRDKSGCKGWQERETAVARERDSRPVLAETQLATQKPAQTHVMAPPQGVVNKLLRDDVSWEQANQNAPRVYFGAIYDIPGVLEDTVGERCLCYWAPFLGSTCWYVNAFLQSKVDQR